MKLMTQLNKFLLIYLNNTNILYFNKRYNNANKRNFNIFKFDKTYFYI